MRRTKRKALAFRGPFLHIAYRSLNNQLYFYTMETNKYDEFYKKYGANVHDDPVRFAKIAALCKGSVLDIACGTGTLADFYAGKYEGTDVSKEAIRMAKEIRRKNAVFLEENILTQEAYWARKYDTIVIAEFLEHIEDDKLFLQKIMDGLEKDGRLIISVPNGDRVPDEDHKRTFTIPELRKKFEGYGKITFNNWPGAAQRIIMTIDKGQKNTYNLSLVMPVKNEEKGLENAILSALEFCDDIVIAVDKASTDKTLEIAKMYGDTVIEHEWHNSFAEMRNFAQQFAKGQYILALDGHEYIKGVGNLEAGLKSDREGLLVRVQMENGFNFWFPRIVKKSVRWVNEVHNNPEPKTTVRLTGFTIVHDRKSRQDKKAVEERSEQREKMIMGVLKNNLKKNKKDTRALFYIALQHLSRERYRQAIKYYKKNLRYSKNVQERWLVCHDIGMCYVYLGKLFRASWWLFKAEDEIPNRWETYKTLGAIYAQANKPLTAVEWFTKSFVENKEAYVYNPEIRDVAQVWSFIGMCYNAMNKPLEAIISWKRAIKLEKRKEEGEQNVERLKVLEEMVKNYSELLQKK